MKEEQLEPAKSTIPLITKKFEDYIQKNIHSNFRKFKFKIKQNENSQSVTHKIENPDDFTKFIGCFGDEEQILTTLILSSNDNINNIIKICEKNDNLNVTTMLEAINYMIKNTYKKIPKNLRSSSICKKPEIYKKKNNNPLPKIMKMIKTSKQ